MCAVVVTHRRPDELAKSLDVVTTQSRMIDHLIVVDNDHDERVRDLVTGQTVPTTYLGSHRNLGGAGGFALSGFCTRWHWVRTGCGWPTMTAVPATPRCWPLCWRVPASTTSPRCLRWCARLTTPTGWRSRCGGDWCGDGTSANYGRRAPTKIYCPESRRCSTVRFSERTPLQPLGFRTSDCSFAATKWNCIAVWCSGLPFGTCLDTVYLHPYGSDEFKPILGGRMHTNTPTTRSSASTPIATVVTCCPSLGFCKLLPQEWLRFGWFFLVTRRDPAGLREWIRLRRLGRHEQFRSSAE